MDAGCGEFWARVRREEKRLCMLSPVAVMERVNAWLEPVAPQLGVEVTGPPTGVREIAVTAHGAIGQFQAALAWVQQAPVLKWFHVRAFRQRSANPALSMTMEGVELGWRDLLLTHRAERGQVAIDVAFATPVPMDQQERLRNMAFILLDHALGEFDFAVKVGPVDFAVGGDEEGVTLERFPALFDAFWTQALGHDARFPVGPHRWTALQAVADDGAGVLVMRNDSANAVVGRADLGHRLDVVAGVPTTRDLALSRLFEERFGTFLAQGEGGLGSHVLTVAGRQRTTHWQVRDLPRAEAAAIRTARELGLSVDCATAFDPAWTEYRRWVA